MSVLAQIVASMACLLMAGDLMNKTKGWWNLVWILLLTAGLGLQIGAMGKFTQQVVESRETTEVCLNALDEVEEILTGGVESP